MYKSEVCAADETALVNTMNRANLNALCTTCAKRIINGREVVNHSNSTVGTGLLALHTTDTAVGASLSCNGALIVVRAFYHNSGGIVDEVDDAVGTFANTDATTDTLAGVYVSDAILDGNSILGTYSRTVTIAKAGKIARLVTTI